MYSRWAFSISVGTPSIRHLLETPRLQGNRWRTAHTLARFYLLQRDARLASTKVPERSYSCSFQAMIKTTLRTPQHQLPPRHQIGLGAPGDWTSQKLPARSSWPWPAAAQPRTCHLAGGTQRSSIRRKPQPAFSILSRPAKFQAMAIGIGLNICSAVWTLRHARRIEPNPPRAVDIEHLRRRGTRDCYRHLMQGCALMPTPSAGRPPVGNF
jgi:hypothetical protein